YQVTELLGAGVTVAQQADLVLNEGMIYDLDNAHGTISLSNNFYRQPARAGRKTTYWFCSAIILSMRFWWRPPSNSALRKASTIWQPRPAPTTRPPMHRALALLWRRVYSALKVSLQQQARMPCILLAHMDIPTPVPQHRITSAQRPSCTALQPAAAKSG